MNFLEAKILADGVVKPGNVLKVDSFLNHQIDIRLMKKIGEEIKRRFSDVEFNKVLTIESSGIAIASAVAYVNEIPVVFAKKGQTVNSTDDKAGFWKCPYHNGRMCMELIERTASMAKNTK